MFKKGFLVDAVLFVAIVLVLLVVIPIISSILKNLVALQIIIAIVGGLALGVIVRRIRSRAKR